MCRVLRVGYGVLPERTIAVGDAMNDMPMLGRAGFAAAMADSRREVLHEVHRDIGENGTPAIGDLVEKFLLRGRERRCDARICRRSCGRRRGVGPPPTGRGLRTGSGVI